MNNENKNTTDPIIPPQEVPATIPAAMPVASSQPTAPKGPKMVTVSEDALKDLQAQIIDLNKKVNQTADRSRLADFNLKENKKTIPTCRINYYRDIAGDRLILGWGNMVTNKAKYGKNFEQVDQKTVLFLKDETKNEDGTFKYAGGILRLEVDYVSSFQNKFQEEVDIIGRTELSDGRLIFKVQKSDGEEIDMDARFIN